VLIKRHYNKNSPIIRALLVALCLPSMPLHVVHAQTNEVVLDTVHVHGQAMDERVYSAATSNGAKTHLPLRELPQSVQILDRQTIEDLGAQRIDDVLDYVSGVARKEGHGGLWDGLLVRGFANGTEALFNGFAVGRGFAAPRDLSGIERVEFLKGASAALYGSGEPGGTVNIVSKRPLWTAAHSLTARVGSHEFKRASLDSSAPLNDHVAYRLNIAAEDKHGFRDFARSKRSIVTPALTWRLSESTALEYVGEILEQKSPTDRGVVAVNNRLGVIPTTRFLGQPNDGEMINKNQIHQLVLSHDWNTDWSGRVGVTWRDNSLYGYSTEGDLNVPLAANGDITGNRRLRDYQSTDKAIQAEMQGQWLTGKIEHEILLGIEHFNYKEKNRYSASANFVINNIYNPFYLSTLPPVILGTPTLGKQRNNAIYLQDAITLAPQWRLLAGLRFDDYQQENWNLNTGIKTADISPSATSPRIGLSYLPNENWTVFTNISRAFKPNTGTDVNNNPFEPIKSIAADFGAKWENSDKTLGATLAAFTINKKNVKTADPNHAGFSIAAGEVRSQGVEFDFSGHLNSFWRLTSSFTYTDAKVHADNTLLKGAPVQHVAKIGSGLHITYENTLANSQRYGVGAGGVYNSKRLGQSVTQANATQGRFYLPAYAIARLNAYWQVARNTRINLDVDNVFNKTYYSNALGRVAVIPGTERAFTLGVRLNF